MNRTPAPGELIAVWFSCGAASAVAAMLTVERYGKTNPIRILNNPVREEHPDNIRFLRDVEKKIGVKIESVTNEKFPHASAVKVWDKRKYMSGTKGAPCTYELKKIARQQWQNENKPVWHVLGFTSDECARFERFKKTELPNTLAPLVTQMWTKEQCFSVLDYKGIRLPEIYSLGYPNANCIGCVKATSPTYWNHVRKTFPRVFKSRAKQSERIGARLVRVKNKRIFLSELDPLAKGRPMKNYKMPECGIFCEEKKV